MKQGAETRFSLDNIIKLNHIQNISQRKTKVHRRIWQDPVYQLLKRQQTMHVCMIFAPKLANNIRNQQAQRKKTVKRTMAIPGFLKAFADSHTFLYSKNGKTPTSSLFSVLLLIFSTGFNFLQALSRKKKKKTAEPHSS